MNDEEQFESFKEALARFVAQTNHLVDWTLSADSSAGHLVPLVPWISEVMSVSLEPEFQEQVALAYWSRMGLMASSQPARLKILELDGLSTAIRQTMAQSDPGRVSDEHRRLLYVCSLTVGSLLDAIGEMFPLVRGLLRSTQDAIDVARC